MKKYFRRVLTIIMLSSILAVGSFGTGCGSKTPTSPAPKGQRIGAICNDGTESSATGRGACSSHGGVDYWLYED